MTRRRPRFRLLSLMLLVAIVGLGIAARRSPEFWRRSREAARMEAEYRDAESVSLARGETKLVEDWRHLAAWALERKLRFARAAVCVWEPEPRELPVTPRPLSRPRP